MPGGFLGYIYDRASKTRHLGVAPLAFLSLLSVSAGCELSPPDRGELNTNGWDREC